MLSALDKASDAFFIKLPLKFLKRNVVRGLGGALPRKALLYFKTDPLFSKRLVRSYEHTNNSEILIMLEILHRFGFSVDLVDRDAPWTEIEPLLSQQYDVYIGNAAGASAPMHTRILRQIDAATRIFFGAGPEPDESNRLVEARHQAFDDRCGKKSLRRRLVHESDLAERFKSIDAIFYVGNEFGRDTYSKHGIPSYRIFPSSSPKLSISEECLLPRSPKRFLYFGGNGLICKGLDLVLEAFDGEAELQLDICGPAGESDFWAHYAPLVGRNPQIRYHGFVKVGSRLFQSLTAECAFNVFPGSAEGCATSVTTCMRRGVVPVTTRETGVDLGDFGIPITSATVPALKKLTREASMMEPAELRRRILGTYAESFRYTDSGFRQSFELALFGALSARRGGAR